MRSALYGLFVLLSCVASARADDVILSARGRQIVDGAIGGSWSNEREPGLLFRQPHWSVWLQPSWVYFIRDRIGIGGYVGYTLSRASVPSQVRELYRDSVSTSDKPLPTYLRTPLSHDASFGITGTFEVGSDDRLTLFVRPYAGVALSWREVYRHFPLFPGSAIPLSDGYQVQRELYVRAELGVRVPIVYRLDERLGFGIGPDFACQLGEGYDTFRFGVSTWIVRSL